MTRREEFIAAARSYLGTVWRHQGRDRHGLDCVGLIVAAARDIGVHVDGLPNYRRADRNKFMDAVLAHTTDIASVPRPGDLIVLRYHVTPIHIGVLAHQSGRRTMIHAGSQARAVVEEPITPELATAIVAYRSFTGLD